MGAKPQINILVDEKLFKAAKIKEIKTNTKVQDILRERLAEWVREDGDKPKLAKEAA